MLLAGTNFADLVCWRVLTSRSIRKRLSDPSIFFSVLPLGKMKNQPLKLGEKTAQYPYGYGFCQCGCGEKTSESSTGVYPMYLSRKNRPANSTDHEMVKLYEQEQRNTLGKMRTITREVELVAKNGEVALEQ